MQKNGKEEVINKNNITKRNNSLHPRRTAPKWFPSISVLESPNINMDETGLSKTYNALPRFILHNCLNQKN